MVLNNKKKSVKWTLFLIHNLFSCNAVTDISYRIFYVWTLTRKQKSFATKKKIWQKKKKICEKLFPEFLFLHISISRREKTIIYITLFLFSFFFRGQKEYITYRINLKHQQTKKNIKYKEKLETKNKKREGIEGSRKKKRRRKSVFLSFSFMFLWNSC